MTDPPTMNRWIISYKDRVAKRLATAHTTPSLYWWIVKAPGPQSADATTIVYVKDMGGGNIALQTCGIPGESDAYVSMTDGNLVPKMLAFWSQSENFDQGWITQPSGRETFQATPAGDGGFTLTCPSMEGFCVSVDDEQGLFPQGGFMVGHEELEELPASHFTAVGLDRPIALDFLKLGGKNLSGLSFAGVDLSNKNLAGYNLSSCDFRQATSLDSCIMNGANLQNAKFAGCTLAGAKLNKASLAGADFGGADLADADFTGTDLTGVRCSAPLKHLTDPNHRAIFTGCTVPYALIGLDWSCLDLTGATITGMPTNPAGQANLAGLNAQGLRRPRGDFIKAVLDGANFAGASLAGANFSDASLQGKASFAGATMPGAFFIGAILDQADFTGATLDGADRTEAANFSYAYLSNCVFTGAGLYAVIFTGATLIELTLAGPDVNLQQADFSDAYLPNADFTGASLQGAKFNGACMVECTLTNADLTPAAQGTLQASLAAACLQGATLAGTKLGGASLPNAAVTDTDGQITVQYYDQDGTLTDPYPMPYTGTSYPDASSLSDTTVCPNTITYQENQSNGLTIAQMMTPPQPPTQWKPRNTMTDREQLVTSTEPRD
jgi:uncharacterized protein YjbI with pentapeptide repeats